MEKKNKALIERIENFERVKQKYLDEGYHSKKVVVGIVRANVVAIGIGIVSAIVMFGIYMSVHKSMEESFSIERIMNVLLVLCVIDLLSIAIHEVLHGITWAFFCKRKWKSIQFGIMWKYVTPYCSCLEPLDWKYYLLGGLMPFLVLGIGFFLVSLVWGSEILLVLAILNVVGAGGDLMVATKIIRHHEGILMDLPQECGYLQFYK